MDNKVLGKGLSALIPQKTDNFHSDLVKPENNSSSLDIDLIQNNRYQPRKNYDESKLEDLKSSIKEKGVLQPILVRPVGNHYEVVAGERRLRASRAVGLKQVPVVIKNITDREALVLALVENIQREELNPIEEAQGFKRLIDEFQLTQEAVAESVGKDRSTVTNLIRLLKLPQAIQQYVATGKISMGHARSLLSIDNSAQQLKLAESIIHKGLSVRQIESLVKKAQEPAVADVKPVSAKNRDIQILEEELGRVLGTKVIVNDKNNKGKITIEYYSLNDFDRILEILRK